MEKWPNRPNKAKDALDPKDRQLEVINLERLGPADIGDEDRVFVHTESGNRYMLRHSRSRDGQLVIYNEREGGFSAETARPFLMRRDSSTIAEVGKNIQVFAITDEHAGTGAPLTSTKVTRIEIRRNLEGVIRARSEQSHAVTSFQEIARALRAEAAPPPHSGQKKSNDGERNN